MADRAAPQPVEEEAPVPAPARTSEMPAYASGAAPVYEETALPAGNPVGAPGSAPSGDPGRDAGAYSDEATQIIPTTGRQSPRP
jgi:hypothetical protein